ncbi:hypothetical protein [Leifsonia poae]|uniref:hypothetical protein n=1 Tax=Leifsonia poae TaxID=110933 RepID=UPI001CBF92A2|nr:hypothetical protein [Leifsonia poae]
MSSVQPGPVGRVPLFCCIALFAAVGPLILVASLLLPGADWIGVLCGVVLSLVSIPAGIALGRAGGCARVRRIGSKYD